ncbi:vacuolar iron transporter family protein, partial [Phenoliferia sp. Uapishka_3]
MAAPASTSSGGTKPSSVALPTRPKSDAATPNPVWSLSAAPPTPGGTPSTQVPLGLTVPFALTAGLSSLGSSRLVYVAGVAELVSGALSMGVGGYLSAQAERDHYRYLRKSTRVSPPCPLPPHPSTNPSQSTTKERVLRSCAGELERETAAILSPLGIEDSLSRRVAGALLSIEATLPIPQPPPSIFRQCLQSIARRPRFSGTGGGDEERTALLSPKGEDGEEDEKGLTAFLLKFGEGLEEVSDSRLFISAFTIGAAYFLGGLVPLLPYFMIESARTALYVSIAITTVVLLLFGGFKTYFTGAAIGFSGCEFLSFEFG